MIPEEIPEEFDVACSNEEIIEVNNINSTFKNGVIKWEQKGKNLYAIGKTTDKAPPGHYTVQYDRSKDCFYLRREKILNEKILKLPDNNLQNIIGDIQQFWDSEESYNKYGYVYKRGILLYGPPGCGKTSIINLLTDELITKHKGIVISFYCVDDVYRFDFITDQFREIEPDTPIICIFEDVDNFADANKEYITKLLNVLDGNQRANKIVVIATTNYPEKLEERISNRPSRFDRRYEIGIPNAKVRKYYIENMVTDDDLKTIDIDEWVKSTEKFTLDHLKELVLSVFVLKNDFDESVSIIKDMMENGHIKPTKIGNKSVGFNTKKGD